MEFIANLFFESLGKVWITFTHNWPFLLASVLISVGLKLYIQPEKVSAFLTRYRKVGVLGATVVAVATPFCSCGTPAVILGMIASTIPWSPIVAFMVASPLTSPEELVYSAGLFGWPFAIAFFASSILLGLLGGALAEFCEARGWLDNQARFAPATRHEDKLAEKPIKSCTFNAVRQDDRFEPALAAAQDFAPVTVAPVVACGCSLSAPAIETCGCGSQGPAPVQVDEREPIENLVARVTLRQWLDEIYQTGGKLLLMFLGFAFLGYVLNGLIPPAWVSAIFGKGNIYSVPLAATLGLPLYINTEGSLPLVGALIEGGMSQGAVLAFLITGAGTSSGAIGGALIIARWRVITLVIGTLWAGSILLGYTYNFLLASHLFS